MVVERRGVVIFGGKPVTLLGEEIKPGMPMPEFDLIDNSNMVVRSGSFKGKVCIISFVPSLDTAICDAMTRRFNEEAARLGADVSILTISMDLPFAQKRWCGVANVKQVQTLSDHRDAKFGEAFGVLIKEARLLTRSVFIVDRKGFVRYAHYLKDNAQSPNYDQILKEINEVLAVR